MLMEQDAVHHNLQDKMDDIKKAIIGVLTLAITTGGGLLIKSLFEGDKEEVVKEEVATPAAQPNVIINIPQQEVKKDTIVKKVYVKPKPKLSETEKRKKKIDWQSRSKTKKETEGGNLRSPVNKMNLVTFKTKTMNNYINPFLIIKEELSEATTISQKSLVIFVSLWAAMLSTLVVSGVSYLIYELFTNPSTFDNATWGIFDTLG